MPMLLATNHTLIRKSVHKLGFSRRKRTSRIYIYKEIYYEAHVIIEAKKSHDLLSAHQRAKKAYFCKQRPEIES